MKCIELAGSPRHMGRAFGEACRAEVHELYRARVLNAIDQARSYGGRTVDEAGLLSIATRCLPFVRAHSAKGWAELQGIAEGADLSLPRLWAMNALTDLRDLAAFGDPRWLLPDAEGCTAALVGPGRGTDGSLLAQTWDLATDNLPFVRLVVRRPDGGPATVSMTLVGCLSLIGLNEEGVVVGTTNVRTVDGRLGVGYLDVIHSALAETSRAAAVERVRRAHRAGAHFYYVGGPGGGVSAIECSALRDHVRELEPDEAYVHTNHMLEPDNRSLEVQGTPMGSSRARYRRMSELLRDGGQISVRDLQRFLADQDGGENAIDRRDFNGISSNGAVVIEPRARRIHVVWGPASRGEWITYDLVS